MHGLRKHYHRNTSTGVVGALCAALTGLSAVPFADPADAAEFKTIYSFKGGVNSGRSPRNAPPVVGPDGALYGTAYYGGSANCFQGCGVIYKLKPPAPGTTKWTEQILYRFTGGADRFGPLGGLTRNAKSGALFGVTGTTVFMLKPPAAGDTVWMFQTLHQFTGGTDGQLPSAGLATDAAGAVYGTTRHGGIAANCADFTGNVSAGCGTIFKLTRTAGSPWSYTVIHRFQGGGQGLDPEAEVVVGRDGAVFGTTYLGGACGQDAKGCGTVFRLTPPASSASWAFRVLYRFKGGTQGAYPKTSLLLDEGGNLYGTTFQGGTTGIRGALFRLEPPAATSAGTEAGPAEWSKKDVHSFTGGADGSGPTGRLTPFCQKGVALAAPQGGSAYKGAFFLMMSTGWPFRLYDPDAAFRRLLNRCMTGTRKHTPDAFSLTSDGRAPMGGLVYDPAAQTLYGTTELGGTFGFGTVFRDQVPDGLFAPE
jgi:hypothetical protein